MALIAIPDKTSRGLALRVRVATLALTAVAMHTAQAQRSDTIVKLVTAPRYKSSTVVTDWKIGSADGDESYQFNGIQETMIAQDGKIWVIDAINRVPNVRLFDSAGKFIRRIGGTGAGPGEYTSLNGIGQLPDGRVLLRDEAQSRINLYRPDGTPDMTWVLRTRYGWLRNGRGGVRVDVHGIVWLPFYVGDPPAVFVRLRSNGTVLDTVKTPPVKDPPRTTMVMMMDKSTYSDGDRNSRSVVSALSPLGFFVTGVNTRYAFEILRSPRPDPMWKPGDRVISVQRDAPPVSVSKEERENAREILQFRIDRALAMGYRMVTPPGELLDTKPAYRYMQFGPEGRLWLGVPTASEKYEPPPPAAPPPGSPPRPPEPPFRWRDNVVFDVFEPDGAYVGRVATEFPSYRRGDTLLTISVDEDGVNFLAKQHVVWK